MTYATNLSGRIGIKPDFTTVGSVPNFDNVKLEYRTLLQDPGVQGVFVPATFVIEGIAADAPAWATEEAVLNDLIAIVENLPEGTTFDGYLEGNGEEIDDMWRVYIVDGKPTVVKPRIVWPEVPGAAA